MFYILLNLKISSPQDLKPIEFSGINSQIQPIFIKHLLCVISVVGT